MSTSVFSVEVIMAAYNQVDYTRLVLEAYTRQTDSAFSLAIADDGSGPEMAELVKQYQQRGLNVRHVWHEDKGFRRAEILNKAIASSTADYLIFSDNDCMPQKEFIADHKRVARKGYFVVGRRVNLNSTLSERFVDGKYDVSRINSRLWLILNSLCSHAEYAEQGLRIPWFISGRISKKDVRLLGANTGIWREDVLAVNGYDSDFIGYGLADTDIEWRLLATGLRSQSIKGRGCVVHLYHPERRRTQRNLEIMKARQEKGIIRVRNGVVRADPEQ